MIRIVPGKVALELDRLPFLEARNPSCKSLQHIQQQRGFRKETRHLRRFRRLATKGPWLGRLEVDWPWRTARRTLEICFANR